MRCRKAVTCAGIDVLPGGGQLVEQLVLVQLALAAARRDGQVARDLAPHGDDLGHGRASLGRADAARACRTSFGRVPWAPAGIVVVRR